jgi:hypothetical protein
MSIRVSTLNAWLFGAGLSPYNAERREAIISRVVMEQLDVIALQVRGHAPVTKVRSGSCVSVTQEVWSTLDANELIRLASDGGPQHFARGTGGASFRASHTVAQPSRWSAFC